MDRREAAGYDATVNRRISAITVVMSLACGRERAEQHASPPPAAQLTPELLQTKEKMREEILRAVKQVRGELWHGLEGDTARVAKELDLIVDLMVGRDELGVIVRGRCTREDLISIRDALLRLKIDVRSTFSQLRCWATTLELK